MARLFQITGVVALTALCLGAVVYFMYGHRGYPDAVYFERVTITSTTLQPMKEQIDMWVDPQRNLELRVTDDGTVRYTTLVDQHARRVREFQDGLIISKQSMQTDEAAAQVSDWQQLLHGGFRALANHRLAHAAGPITHVVLDGHDALRFDTTQHDGETQRLTVWIDAHTHDPLQLQVQTAYYNYTQRVDSFRRIDPATLPASLFDPPRPATSYWDLVLHWLRGKLGAQQS